MNKWKAICLIQFAIILSLAVWICLFRCSQISDSVSARKIMPEEQQIVDKLKGIMIPEVEFRSAHLHDVVGFFFTASKDFDKQGRGQNIVYHNPIPAEPNPNYSDANPISRSMPKYIQPQPPGPLVTFHAIDISLYDAISMTCKLAGADFSIENGVVVIRPKNKNVQQEN